MFRRRSVGLRRDAGWTLALKTLEFFERLMEERTVDAAALDVLLQQPLTKEDQFLDYKSGLLLDDKRKATAVVRKYVTGFANAVGGVLVLGVNEKQNHVIDGCKPIGAGTLSEWASRALTDVAANLSPPPVFCEITHPSGSVLCVGAYRAGALVPVVVAGRAVYYLRMGDQTLEAPDYLVSDLLLGRRQKPEFKVAATALWSDVDNVSIVLSVENVSLTAAKRLTFVWAYPTIQTPSSSPLGATIERYVVVSGAVGGHSLRGAQRIVALERTQQPPQATTSLGPFERATVHGTVVPIPAAEVPLRVRVGALLVGDGFDPTLVQMDFNVDDARLRHALRRRGGSPDAPTVTTEIVHSGRLSVSFEEERMG